MASGLGLLIWGVDPYTAFGASLTRTLGGVPCSKAMTAPIGGAVCAVLGIFWLK